MKRRMYKTPTMKVVKLKHKSHVLSVSSPQVFGVSATTGLGAMDDDVDLGDAEGTGLQGMGADEDL